MKTFTRYLSLAVTALALSACGQNPQPLNYNQFGFNNNGTGMGQIPTQGGCVPLQTGSFGFAANNASMSLGALYAGNIPGAGQFGQVVMGGTSLGGMGAGMIQYQPKQGPNGNLQLGATVNQSGQANVTGMIQLAPSVIQTVMYASGGMWGGNWGGMNGMPTNGVPQNTAGPCVSSIAIRAVQNVILNQTNPYGGYNPYGGMNNQIGMGGGTGQILRALVYLYLNNGTPIGPFEF